VCYKKRGPKASGKSNFAGKSHSVIYPGPEKLPLFSSHHAAAWGDAISLRQPFDLVTGEVFATLAE